MPPNKKAKGAKTKGGKPSGKRPSGQPQKDEAGRDATAGSAAVPQERVAVVRPCWESLPLEQRVALLTIDLDTLRARAKQLSERAREQAVEDAGDGLLDFGVETSLEEVLEEGLRRLGGQRTWKLWQWPPDGAEFHDADSFRAHVHAHAIREDLLKLLPKDDPKSPEKPAEAALRQRMSDLLQRVQASNRLLQDEGANANANASAGGGRGGRRGQRGAQDLVSGAARDTNVETTCTMLEALEQEHEQLYQSLLRPITAFVCELLPEESRETTASELYFEDLERCPPDEVARVCEWLTEKVDALSAKLKAEPKEDEEEEDEEENMGDVDLFALAPDGSSLTVNAKWLQHLQERLLGEDGHPRKVAPGEDPHNMGLVLEWVYGSIVSTAEKARDGAKRQLGVTPPSAAASHMALIQALEDQASWEARARQAKELLNQMLQSRKDAQELAKRYDIRPVPKNEAGEVITDEAATALPEEVIVAMLQRETLLTAAKLHALVFEHIMGDKALRSLKTQIRQGEPELERLKRELEEIKHAPRGLEGTFRTAAEMERHRHQLADAAIEEQLEVQTAFREQGTKLQGLYDKKQRTEFEMAKRETEIKQLQGWKATVDSLIERFQDGMAQAALFAAELAEATRDAQPSPTFAPNGGANMSQDGPLAAAAAAEADRVAAELANGAETGTAGKAAAAADGELDAAAAPASPGAAAATSPAANGTTAIAPVVRNPQQLLQLSKLRAHFLKDVRRQLYTETDDRSFFNRIKDELKVVEKRLEDGRAALQHLEMHLINVACDDPGAVIGAQLALPILQERLDAAALEYAAKRAAMAESEIIRMEMEAAEREAAERERRAKAKQKKQGKCKNEKERMAAEKAAKEAADRVAAEANAAARAKEEAEERARRAEAMEKLRKEEEELMERRRLELLADQSGYWAQRVAEEELQRAALALAIGGAADADDEVVSALQEELLSEHVNESAANGGERGGQKGDEEGFVSSAGGRGRRPGGLERGPGRWRGPGAREASREVTPHHVAAAGAEGMNGVAHGKGAEGGRRQEGAGLKAVRDLAAAQHEALKMRPLSAGHLPRNGTRDTRDQVREVPRQAPTGRPGSQPPQRSFHASKGSAPAAQREEQQGQAAAAPGSQQQQPAEQQPGWSGKFPASPRPAGSRDKPLQQHPAAAEATAAPPSPAVQPSAAAGSITFGSLQDPELEEALRAQPAAQASPQPQAAAAAAEPAPTANGPVPSASAPPAAASAPAALPQQQQPPSAQQQQAPMPSARPQEPPTAEQQQQQRPSPQGQQQQLHGPPQAHQQLQQPYVCAGRAQVPVHVLPPQQAPLPPGSPTGVMLPPGVVPPSLPPPPGALQHMPTLHQQPPMGMRPMGPAMPMGMMPRQPMAGPAGIYAPHQGMPANGVKGGPPQQPLVGPGGQPVMHMGMPLMHGGMNPQQMAAAAAQAQMAGYYSRSGQQQQQQPGMQQAGVPIPGAHGPHGAGPGQQQQQQQRPQVPPQQQQHRQQAPQQQAGQQGPPPPPPQQPGEQQQPQQPGAKPQLPLQQQQQQQQPQPGMAHPSQGPPPQQQLQQRHSAPPTLASAPHMPGQQQQQQQQALQGRAGSGAAMVAGPGGFPGQHPVPAGAGHFPPGMMPPLAGGPVPHAHPHPQYFMYGPGGMLPAGAQAGMSGNQYALPVPMMQQGMQQMPVPHGPMGPGGPQQQQAQQQQQQQQQAQQQQGQQQAAQPPPPPKGTTGSAAGGVSPAGVRPGASLVPAGQKTTTLRPTAQPFVPGRAASAPAPQAHAPALQQQAPQQQPQQQQQQLQPHQMAMQQMQQHGAMYVQQQQQAAAMQQAAMQQMQHLHYAHQQALQHQQQQQQQQQPQQQMGMGPSGRLPQQMQQQQQGPMLARLMAPGTGNGPAATYARSRDGRDSREREREAFRRGRPGIGLPDGYAPSMPGQALQQGPQQQQQLPPSQPQEQQQQESAAGSVDADTQSRPLQQEQQSAASADSSSTTVSAPLADDASSQHIQAEHPKMHAAQVPSMHQASERRNAPNTIGINAQPSEPQAAAVAAGKAAVVDKHSTEGAGRLDSHTNGYDTAAEQSAGRAGANCNPASAAAETAEQALAGEDDSSQLSPQSVAGAANMHVVEPGTPDVGPEPKPSQGSAITSRDDFMRAGTDKSKKQHIMNKQQHQQQQNSKQQEQQQQQQDQQEAVPASSTSDAPAQNGPSTRSPAAPTPLSIPKGPQQPMSWSTVASGGASPPGNSPTKNPALGSTAGALSPPPSLGGSPPNGTASPVAPQGSWRAGADSLKRKLQQVDSPPAAAAKAQPASTMAALGAPARANSGDAGLRSSAGVGRGVERAGSGSSTASVHRTGSGHMVRLGSIANGVAMPAKEEPKVVPAKLTVLDNGTVVVQDADGSSYELRLVRGLANENGANDCFLNVVIQSLWHLAAFRKALLSSAPAPGPSAAQDDAAVMAALTSVFTDMYAPPAAADNSAAGAAVAATANGTAADAAAAGGAAAAGAAGKLSRMVSPAALRAALSRLQPGGAALSVHLSDMHDASEVLDDLLGALHRSETGRALAAADDPQLPRRVRVRSDPPGSALAMAAPHTSSSSGGGAFAHANGSVGGAGRSNGALLFAPPTGPPPVPRSLVHRLFGLDVQVPVPLEDGTDDGSTAVKGRKRAAAQPTPLVAPPAKRPGGVSGVMEVQQFMKFFHLVHAQTLRQAHESLGHGAAFEEVLRAADTETVIRRRPAVFTLAVVWDSHKAPMDAISGTVDALAPALELSQLFRGLASAAHYRLRCVVCYFGHHYQAFALSEELQQWLLFDDGAIRAVGDWAQVKRTMKDGRLQPSLLFYEAK